MSACGDAGSTDPAAGEDGIVATGDAVLGVFEPGVDVADQPEEQAATEFRAGEDGESLVARDVVRTDPSGFAEVAWFDGALARVDADSTYTLLELDSTPGVAVVVTELSVGRIWNRLRDGAVATYEVRTDVGTAAVRGTAFWVACTSDGACTFAVLEGSVLVETVDGTSVELRAGQELTVSEEGRPAATLPTDPDEDWVALNAELDAARGFAPLDRDEPPDDDEVTVADLDCPLDAPAGWDEVGGPFPEFRDSPCYFVRPGAAVGQFVSIEVSGTDSPEGREAVLAAAQERFDEVETRVAGEACAAGSRSMFEPVEASIGDGTLFGYWWRVTIGPLPEGSDATCVGGQGSLRYFVVRDGMGFEMRVEYESTEPFMDQLCSSRGFELLTDEYKDCLWTEHERVDAEARTVASEFLGS